MAVVEVDGSIGGPDWMSGILSFGGDVWGALVPGVVDKSRGLGSKTNESATKRWLQNEIDRQTRGGGPPEPTTKVKASASGSSSGLMLAVMGVAALLVLR